MSKPTLRRKEVDAYSTSSSRASRGSGEKNRKKSGFSITRLFCRRPSSRKSVRSTRSFSDVETRSVSSLQPSQSDRDMQAASAELGDDLNQQKRAKDWVECPLCLMYQPKDNFPPISTCHHRSCRLCLRQYLKIEITESRVNITCPECSERFHPNDIKMILSDKSLMRKYEEFMLRRVLVMNPDTRWCPAPDCGFAVIATGCASCPKLRCERPGCGTHFCYHCKQYWHPNQTCDAARAERSSNMRSSSISYSHESGSQKRVVFSEDDIKPCPRCGVFIVKMDDGSCNHVTCAVCGSEFCWLCMKEISDLHYLSPSGCTFWGKKPWSRKKKILWQLGTLVGAPVGIALVAGIAVPAIVIGVPIWVGRKLHAKYEAAHKHKRNLIVTGGVMGAVLISPLLAGLAVGIGVPILLAYVYCVVPISLCRSGGCGVTTNSGGVRFEFEEQNEGAAAAAGVSGPYSGPDANSVGANSHQAGNPSIGPSIGEMSLGMTNSLSASGSNIDRVGILREESDRESASNRAIAGESLNGSITGSAVAGPSGYHNRLEVQADVAANPTTLQKRSSMSSESANFSLDAKSATVSFGDDASTKALAGSICNRDKDDQSVIMPPLEVQVDVVNTSARYRHSSSVSGAVPRSPPPATRSCYRHSNSTSGALPRSSPTSSRSVNFLGEEILEPDSRTKHYKRQSASVGDAIHERTTLERRSARSLLTADSSLDALGRSDASNKRACASVRRGSAQSSLASDNRCYDKSSAGAGGALPEVESDHPDLASGFTRTSSSSSGSDNTETVSALGEPYSPCFESDSLTKIDGCSRTDSMLSTEPSSDCSSTDSTVPLNKQSPKLSFLKRHSCEVALNEGVFTFPQRESKL